MKLLITSEQDDTILTAAIDRGCDWVHGLSSVDVSMRDPAGGA
jgi:hypothetical protein